MAGNFNNNNNTRLASLVEGMQKNPNYIKNLRPEEIQRMVPRIVKELKFFRDNDFIYFRDVKLLSICASVSHAEYIKNDMYTEALWAYINGPAAIMPDHYQKRVSAINEQKLCNSRLLVWRECDRLFNMLLTDPNLDPIILANLKNINADILKCI